MVKQIITPKVKEAVGKAVAQVLEETQDVDMTRIIEILEREHKIKFFNMEVLQKLVKEELENMVFIHF